MFRQSNNEVDLFFYKMSLDDSKTQSCNNTVMLPAPLFRNKTISWFPFLAWCKSSSVCYPQRISTALSRNGNYYAACMHSDYSQPSWFDDPIQGSHICHRQSMQFQIQSDRQVCNPRCSVLRVLCLFLLLFPSLVNSPNQHRLDIRVLPVECEKTRMEWQNQPELFFKSHRRRSLRLAQYFRRYV